MDLPFFCDVCGSGETCYGTWLVHVTTQRHQEGLRLLGDEALEEIRSPGVRERVLIAHDVPSWMPLIEVAQYFATWGQLRNVWYRGPNEVDSSRMRILLIFDTVDGVDAVMYSAEPYVLDGVVLDVERLFVTPYPIDQDGFQPEDPYSPINRFGYGEEEIRSHCGSVSNGIPALFGFEMGPPSSYDEPSGFGGYMEDQSDYDSSYYLNSGYQKTPPKFPRRKAKRKNKRSRVNSPQVLREDSILKKRVKTPEILRENSVSGYQLNSSEILYEEEVLQQPVETLTTSTRHSADETEETEIAEIKTLKPKEDSSYEMETEAEDDDYKSSERLSFQEIRKSRIRMNQTLRRYFENAMSRILPQLLDDLSREATVEDIIDELVSAVEAEDESSETEEEMDVQSSSDKRNELPLELPSNESSLEKVLVDDEFQKVVENEDGDVFVIKKKNLNQIPHEEFEESEDDEDEEDNENQKRRSLYIATRKKFQHLWFQFLKEFNSIFWTECFGFQLETPADEDWNVPEYARISKDNFQKTLQQRWAELPETENQGSLTFRCLTGEELSDILYKKKVWKRKFLSTHLKSLWSIVSGRADAEPHEYDEAIECVRLKAFIPFERRLEFSGTLELALDLREEIPPDARLGTTASLRISDESYGMGGKGLRAKKLRFLATVYERLAMKFANVRVKQWLANCVDFDFETYNAAFKKDRKKRQGHPKWRKFRKKWKALGMIY